MVQHPLQHLGGRDGPYSRGNSWPDRNFDEFNDGRFTAPQQPVHPRVMPVQAALRDCAGLSVREFALYVEDENGEYKAYSSTSLTPYQQKIFSGQFKKDFHHTIQQVNRNPHARSVRRDAGSQSDSRYHFSGGSSSEGRRRLLESPSEDSDDDSSCGKRKRSKASHSVKNEDMPAPILVHKTQTLIVGDEEQVKKFYVQRFKDMQQSSCKVLGKAFVKAIEPKKQTHHPYTKGEDHAPSWWPLHGEIEERARHKEPDHLLKPERVALLVHILRMVVEPRGRQHASVQKVGLNVKKLEEAAMEMMAPWFNEKEQPTNMAKKPYFKEIFKVARLEERYKNGEIDATTRIHVIHGDRASLDNDEDEDEGDEETQEDDDEHETHPTPATTMSPSIVSPTMMQNQLPQQHPESDLPYRNRQVGPIAYNAGPQLEDHSAYSDSRYMPRTVGIGFQSMSPGPLQDPSPIRRPFPPSGYQSPQQGVYQWSQQNMVNQAPSNYYVASPQSTLPPHSAPYLPPPPLIPQQQHMLPGIPPFIPHTSDVSHTRGFDSGPVTGNQFRTGSLGHAHPHQMPHAHGFPEYMHEGVGHGQNEADMKDEHMYSH